MGKKTKQPKSEVRWLVIINLAGISGPIRCNRPDTTLLGKRMFWDRTGNYDAPEKEGVTKSDGYIAFSTRSKILAQSFADGARSLGSMLQRYVR